MKKLIPILLATVALVACQKDPNFSELSSDYLVYTDYDKSEDFKNFATYYLPDSVFVMDGKEESTYWKGDKADAFLAVWKENMDSRGFTRVFSHEEADLGLQISYIENTSYFVTNPMYDYWWWGYPGYWGPGYWGPYWNDWYYPYYPTYPVVYSYSTNTFIAELVDLKDKTTQVDGKVRLNVLWNSYMVGARGGSAQTEKVLVTRAIDQAFTQSPYLTNK